MACTHQEAVYVSPAGDPARGSLACLPCALARAEADHRYPGWRQREEARARKADSLARNIHRSEVPAGKGVDCAPHIEETGLELKLFS